MKVFSPLEKRIAAEDLRTPAFPALSARNIRFKGGAYRLAAECTQDSPLAGTYPLAIGQSHGFILFFKNETRLRFRTPSKGGNELTVSAPEDVFPVHTEQVEMGGFAVLYDTREAFYHVTKNTGSWYQAWCGGAIAGCQHATRIFIATEDAVFYTEVDGLYTYPTNSAPPRENGKIALPDGQLGRVLRMVSVGDRIYFVREYGITTLVAFADPLNFRFLPPVQGPGGILKYTVAATGKEAYYFSEWGLTRFDGEKTERIEDRAFREIDLSAPFTGACIAGRRLFANVTLKNGEKWLYCYDFDEKEGHFFCKTGLAVHVCRRPAFLCNGYLTVIGEKSGISNPKQTDAWIDTGAFLPAEGREFLLGEFEADADGSYSVDISTENGTYTAQGGGIIRLPRPLRGRKFTVRLHTKTDGFVLRGLRLRGAEVV